MDSKKEGGKFSNIFYLLLLAISLPTIIFLVWTSYGSYMLVDYSAWETRGLNGDMFGGLNTLFSGFAFAGLIVAIILQTRELGFQRKDLAETREILKQQKEEFKKTSKAQERLVNAQNISAQMSALNELFKHQVQEQAFIQKSMREEEDEEKRKKLEKECEGLGSVGVALIVELKTLYRKHYNPKLIETLEETMRSACKE